MKIAAALVSFVLALYLLVVNFSAVESKYACTGTLTGVPIPENSQVFVRLKDYRFWVGLWSKSDGDFWIEVPSLSVGYFSHLNKAGDTYGVFEAAEGRFAGNFSKLSGKLDLKITEKLAFEGTCTPR